MDYYTQAVLDTSVVIKDQRTARPLEVTTAQPLLAFGEVDVTWQTVAFKKIKFGTRENIGLGPVDIPPQSLSTTAAWLSPDADTRREMKTAGYRTSEGVMGLRNLAMVALPIVAMCDSRDLGGVVDSKNLGTSTVILYDRYPGGLGYCEKGFARMEEVLAICQEMVRDCPCEEGCPSCVGLPNLRPAIHSRPRPVARLPDAEQSGHGEAIGATVRKWQRAFARDLEDCVRHESDCYGNGIVQVHRLGGATWSPVDARGASHPRLTLRIAVWQRSCPAGRQPGGMATGAMPGGSGVSSVMIFQVAPISRMARKSRGV